MGNRTAALQLYNQAVTTANDPSNPKHKELAFEQFSAVIGLDPTWWNGYFQYGNNTSDLRMIEASVAAWRRALTCEMKPDERAKVLSNLSWRLHDVGRIKEAFELAKEAVALTPNEPNPHINLAVIYGTLGNSHRAVEHARIAKKLAPENTIAGMALSFALLFDRQLAAGFKEFEVRYQYRLKNFLQYPYPVWQGEPGKTVFLVADQGLGDTICFARFVAQAAARCPYLHIYIQPELLRWFTHAFIRLPNVNIIPFQANCPFPAADAWTTFVSLPFGLGLTDDEIRNTPNIDYPVYGLPNSWKVPDQKLHVGIAWAGSPLNDIDQHRSIPVKHFLDLYRVPGVQLYSLQVGERMHDLHQCGAGGLIRDLSAYVADVCSTIGLLQELDLVICCESALGHICSAIGKEAWIPYSYLGRDYRIGHDASDVLWAPKHSVIQQGADRRWEPVFDLIVSMLEKRVADHGKEVHRAGYRVPA